VIGARPEDFYGNSTYICDESEATGAPGGESFFLRPREKNSRSRAREKRRAVMEITVLIQKGCGGNPLHPKRKNTSKGEFTTPLLEVFIRFVYFETVICM